MRTDAPRRILVALEEVSDSTAALDTIATLAKQLGAELKGIFVEDRELLHLAALPFSREVGASSANARVLTVENVERVFRARAGQARALLESIAQRFSLSWSFEVARGEVLSQVLQAAAEVDMVAMWNIHRSGLSSCRLGSTVRGVMVHAECSVLMLQQEKAEGSALIAMCDGTPASDCVLDTIQWLSEDQQIPVVVLIVNFEKTFQDIRELIQKKLNKIQKMVRIVEVSSQHLPSLARILEQEQCGLFVAPRNISVLTEYGILEKLGKLGCPVLLCR